MVKTKTFPRKGEYLELDLSLVIGCTCEKVFSIERPADNKVSIKCPDCSKLIRFLLEKDDE